MITRTPTRKATRLDHLVLEAALELFDARGFEAVSDLDVALRAGLTLTEVQDRFTGTHEMLGAILDRATDDLFWNPEPAPTLESLVREHLRLLALDRRLSRVVIREHAHLEQPFRRSWIVRTAAYRERWLVLLRAHAPDWPEARREIVLRAVLAILNTSATRAEDERRTSLALAMLPATEATPWR